MSSCQLTGSFINALKMSSIYIFKVEMTCEGCSGAVERVLNRLKGSGVESFDVNLAEQKVTITSTLDTDKLLETLKKTGKPVTFVQRS